jgi:hypothetical protein
MVKSRSTLAPMSGRPRGVRHGWRRSEPRGENATRWSAHARRATATKRRHRPTVRGRARGHPAVPASVVKSGTTDPSRTRRWSARTATPTSRAAFPEETAALRDVSVIRERWLQGLLGAVVAQAEALEAQESGHGALDDPTVPGVVASTADGGVGLEVTAQSVARLLARARGRSHRRWVQRSSRPPRCGSRGVGLGRRLENRCSGRAGSSRPSGASAWTCRGRG